MRKSGCSLLFLEHSWRHLPTQCPNVFSLPFPTPQLTTNMTHVEHAGRAGSLQQLSHISCCQRGLGNPKGQKSPKRGFRSRDGLLKDLFRHFHEGPRYQTLSLGPEPYGWHDCLRGPPKRFVNRFPYTSRREKSKVILKCELEKSRCGVNDYSSCFIAVDSHRHHGLKVTYPAPKSIRTSKDRTA